MSVATVSGLLQVTNLIFCLYVWQKLFDFEMRTREKWENFFQFQRVQWVTKERESYSTKLLATQLKALKRSSGHAVGGGNEIETELRSGSFSWCSKYLQKRTSVSRHKHFLQFSAHSHTQRIFCSKRASQAQMLSLSFFFLKKIVNSKLH